MTRFWGFVLFIFSSTCMAATEVALVTSVVGAVNRTVSVGTRAPVEAFTKLKQGDQLVLEKNAAIKVVYFESGRQESWQGDGQLEVLGAESRATGLPNADVKILPPVMVKQIARTPALDSQGRAGAVRLRSIASPEALAKLDSTYNRMRLESARNDLNPELFLLSGLFELRELERVEQVLRDLKQARPGDPEVAFMTSLYQKALKNVREAKSN